MSGNRYGFSRREDVTPRVVPVGQPPSRVNLPRTYEARGTNEAARDAVRESEIEDLLVLDRITQMRSEGDDILMGGMTLGSSAGPGGFGSGTSSAPAWSSEFGCWGHVRSLTASAASGYQMSRQFPTHSQILDLLGQTAYRVPVVWTMEDVVAMKRTGGTGGRAGYHFGISRVIGDREDAPTQFVGFYVDIDHPDETANWFMRVCGSSQVGLDADTGYDCGSLHHLKLQVNGADKSVRFWVDGDLLVTYLPADAELWTNTSSANASRFMWKALVTDDSTSESVEAVGGQGKLLVRALAEEE